MNHERAAHKAVRDFMEDTRDKGQYPDGLPVYKVVTVVASYILGNEKYLLTTDLPDDKYYACTYDVGKDEMYLDAYVRIHNETIKMGGA